MRNTRYAIIEQGHCIWEALNIADEEGCLAWDEAVKEYSQ
jgi:hypothetical protein